MKKKSILVGIDDGHANIKIYAGTNPKDGSPIQFKIPSKASLGVIFKSDDQDRIDQEVIEINDTPYTVSEILSDIVDTRTKDYPISNLNKVLIHQCLALAARNGILPEGYREILATTGLPVNRYYGLESGQPDTDFIQKKKDFLLNNDIVINRFDKRNGETPFIFAKHQVFCEAQAAYFDVCMHDDGNLTQDGRDYLDFGAGILDIGGRTTDCLVAAPGGKTFFSGRSGTLDKGVLSFHENIRSRIKARIGNGAEINEKFLQRSIATGTYGLTSSSINIEDILREEKVNLAQYIINFTHKLIGDGKDLAGVICVGGGSIFLENELKELMPQLIFLKDREFANARGFYKMSRHIFRLQND